MSMTPNAQFAVNLSHHGGVANTALVFAFIEKLETAGFKRLPRRTTLAFRRNGHTIVLKRGGGTVTFHRAHDQRPVVTVRPAEIRGLVAGVARNEAMRAVDSALTEVVSGLVRATQASAA